MQSIGHPGRMEDVGMNIHRIGSGRLLNAFSIPRGGSAPAPGIRPDGAPLDALPDDGELYHPAHVERNEDGMPVRYEHERARDALHAAEVEAAYQRGMRFGIAFTCMLAFVITVGVLMVAQAGTAAWELLP